MGQAPHFLGIKMKVIYAQNFVKVEEEGLIHNPDYYDKPNKRAESVVIYGDFPQIKADYDALKIPVTLAGQLLEAVSSKSPNDDLTIPQIKEKLEALNIEFNAKAKKDELLVLLDKSEANQPQDGSEEDLQPE